MDRARPRLPSLESAARSRPRTVGQSGLVSARSSSARVRALSGCVLARLAAALRGLIQLPLGGGLLRIAVGEEAEAEPLDVALGGEEAGEVGHGARIPLPPH